LFRLRWPVTHLAPVFAAAAALPALAGHPMLSEDTGTQGRGNSELELGNAWSRSNGTSTFLFQPQLSYGLSADVDLIVQPAWTTVNTATDAHEQGIGDTNLDFKWRFLGSAPWSLGIRAGVQVPTAQHDLGLPHNRASPHVLTVVTGDFNPLTFNFNIGYAHVPDGAANPQRVHLSAAATFAASERLFYVLDTAVDSNADSTRAPYPAVALLGVIYTARPGLDLDAGYRSRINSVAPLRQWLLGITYRGAW
jgi:hypothetical protein